MLSSAELHRESRAPRAGSGLQGRSDPLTADPLGGTGYRTRSRLGQGGMSEVFLAEHLELGSRMVVKLLHSALVDRADLADRMRVEGQALAVLHHPNIVHVIDAGHTPAGRPFLVMEHLVGRTLGAELRARGALPCAEALLIARSVLAGLAAAHASGIVHRDIKAENIFLHEKHDGRRVAKILDFGVARILEGVGVAPEPLSVPTQYGLLVGTPGYLSPEQALGRPADQRSDLYAVGVVLYKMLSGRGPLDEFGRGNRQITAHVHEQPLPPSHYGKQPISSSLDAVVLKALHKEPEQRFQSAAEFELVLAALEQAPHPSRRVESSPAKRALDEHPKRAVRELRTPPPRIRADARTIAVFAIVAGLTGGLVAALTAWVMARMLG
jgi:eukaryotic-like serine/threonine-protein kinase